MGNRRMGLSRLEALLEAVDRDLNLVNTTLTNCTITTTAAATFSGSVGKVPTGQAFGIYEAAFELKFGATTGGSTTFTTTDNGLVKTVATLPANARIIDAYILTTEVFDSNDEKGVDLVVTSTSPASADTAISGGVVQVITAAEMKSGTSGALNAFVSAVWSAADTSGTSIVASGAGTHLCLINTDTNNVGDAVQTGKVVVYIKYMGSAAPVANTTV
tara:strand:+ start:23 stop:673 length:651 start_codon:yes stop_codon:yes gene_type:complete